MAFFESLRRALHDYSSGVHHAGPPLAKEAERALVARLGRPLPTAYRDLLRSYDGVTLFHEQVQLFGSADPGLTFLPSGALRIGEGEEGAYWLGEDGAVRLSDEAQPDPIVVATDVERLLTTLLARGGQLIDRDGEFRDVFDEEGALKPGARRRRLQAGRKHDPGAALYLLEEAELLLEDREVDAARAALLKAVTHDPGAGAAWELLSALRREAGELDLAAEAALRAAEATRHPFLRASRLLDAAQLATDPAARQSHLREAWAADPNHAAALLAEAEEILAQGERDEAQRLGERLTQLLSLRPTSEPPAELEERAAALSRKLRARASLPIL